MRLIQLVFASLLTIAGPCHAAESTDTASARHALLKALDGQWTMVGDVRGKPVKYDMEASPTLQGTFTEIHMNDVQVPSQYEARVFIGVGKDGQVIAHWLDSFGAKYSVPHGTGQVTDDAIVFNIPYPTGQFRDTLTYERDRDTWKLVIEGAKPDGTFKHFAKYEITRKQPGR